MNPTGNGSTIPHKYGADEPDQCNEEPKPIPEKGETKTSGGLGNLSSQNTGSSSSTGESTGSGAKT
ncbi:hypothetical protein [Candidatus Ichthyocystis hellenicum]|uniref:hypothetical protein n=1 Tax=Candidatus Ichthyocystis hellenicum TaxID=1561003 RepID=UPI000B807386|nr:hypothetical protein [Candidatus Ichthyocystis hellenicum]